ncbi:hypothetical protein HFP72_16370 [Nocardiopsis sp. ARC36]
MRSAGELDRPGAVTALPLPGAGAQGPSAPPPVPDSTGRPEAALLAELAASAAAVRDRNADGSALALVFRAPRPGGLTLDDGAAAPVGTGLPELLERLRSQEAHPERGRWLFARITVSGGEVVLERVYDHWPSWERGRRDGTPENLEFLAAEMAARSPAWRPAWAALLDEASAFDPPWPGPPGRPSVPPARPDAAGRVALLDRIGDLLRATAGRRDWERLRLSYRALVGYAGGTLVATGPAGDEELGLNEDLRAAMALLRSVTYSEGRGAWFGAELVLERNGGGGSSTTGTASPVSPCRRPRSATPWTRVTTRGTRGGCRPGWGSVCAAPGGERWLIGGCADGWAGGGVGPGGGLRVDQ